MEKQDSDQQQQQPGPQANAQLQGNPQMQYQGQPQMQFQANPQMQFQGQPQMQFQGQPQMQYQGQPPMQYQGQPQMQFQGNPQMQFQGQVPMQPMLSSDEMRAMEQQKRRMNPQQQQQMMMMVAAKQQEMQQPVIWMAKPEVIPGCPPGLEYLTQLDQLLVKQQIEIMEILTNIEMCNKYFVRNVLGQQVYFAREESDNCVRQCCGPLRAFTLHVEDNMGQEVIQIIRPYKCMCYGQCFSCAEMCQDEVEVQAPPGETVGFVKQLYENCNISYAIQDVNRQMILRVDGPSYFHCHCPGEDVPFQLNSADGANEVGRISKQWSNLMREYFTDADNFGIQFPIDLDVRMKAVVLGAVFLIDFMFFEMNTNRPQRR